MSSMNPKSDLPTETDLQAIRTKLQGLHGRAFWQSLEELADSQEFQAIFGREFPAFAAEWSEAVSRRHPLIRKALPPAPR